MNKKNGILQFFQWVCSFNFGSFEKEEFKKFLRLGIIFALIIGVYWTLRPLKDAIFIQFVGKYQLPFAKTISVLALLPIVMFYTKLLEKTSREKMLVILPIFYGSTIFLFSILMINSAVSFKWESGYTLKIHTSVVFFVFVIFYNTSRSHRNKF